MTHSSASLPNRKKPLVNSVKDQLDVIYNEQPTEDNIEHVIENVFEQPENFKIFAKGLDFELTARGEYETSTGRILQIVAEPDKVVGFMNDGQPIQMDNGYTITIDNLGVKKATVFIKRLDHQRVLCSATIHPDYDYQTGRDLSPALKPETVLGAVKTVFSFN